MAYSVNGNTLSRDARPFARRRYGFDSHYGHPVINPKLIIINKKDNVIAYDTMQLALRAIAKASMNSIRSFVNESDYLGIRIGKIK